jgi:hypothetical protein
LVLEFESLVGNYIPLMAASVLGAKGYQKMVDDLGEDGTAVTRHRIEAKA